MAARAQRPVFWQTHTNGWRASGLSIDRYCTQHGISKTSFALWRQRLGIGAPAKRRTTPRFVPAILVDPAVEAQADLSSRHSPSPSTPICSADPRKDPVPVIEIRLRGDRVIRVPGDFDEAILTRLVILLESLPADGRRPSAAQSVQG